MALNPFYEHLLCALYGVTGPEDMVLVWETHWFTARWGHVNGMTCRADLPVLAWLDSPQVLQGRVQMPTGEFRPLSDARTPEHAGEVVQAILPNTVLEDVDAALRQELAAGEHLPFSPAPPLSKDESQQVLNLYAKGVPGNWDVTLYIPQWQGQGEGGAESCTLKLMGRPPSGNLQEIQIDAAAVARAQGNGRLLYTQTREGAEGRAALHKVPQASSAFKDDVSHWMCTQPSLRFLLTDLPNASGSRAFSGPVGITARRVRR